MSSSAPCCPPNSEKYLAADYHTNGSITTLPDGTEVYQSGESADKNAILIIPDVFGWNGGRTRNFADQFAEAGYFAVVPKLLVPTFEDGTDGDGLPPTFDFATRGGEFIPYISQITWDGVLRPKIVSTIEFLKSSGVQKISVIGFCWGGWVVVQILDEFADQFVAGVIPHPSIHLEDYFGRSAKALCEKVKRPILLMPAGNDPDSYREGGEIFEALKAANPETETVPTSFADVVHGWSVRGDLNVPLVKDKVEECINRTYAFFAKFL